MELSGKIKVVMETQTFDSGFQKREFVVTTAEQYPQDIKLECIKDKVGLLDDLSEGEQVKVSFNLRGNEYNGRYYVNLQAWKLEKESVTGPPEGQLPSTDDLSFSAEPGDDLPF